MLLCSVVLSVCMFHESHFSKIENKAYSYNRMACFAMLLSTSKLLLRFRLVTTDSNKNSFLYWLTRQSTNIMVSLMLFVLKDTLSIKEEKCSRHADLFVCS